MTNETTVDLDTDYDILYNGDALKWRKFANSVRFRILMQLSGIRNVSDELSGISPLFEGPEDNASYQYPGVTNGATNPPAQAVGPDATDQGHRMAAPFIDRLKATEDPRLPIFAVETAEGEYEGAPPGIFFGNEEPYSRVNPENFELNETVSFMTYSELMFLKAEAAQRELIAGNPAEFLEEAVLSNMNRFGVPETEAAAFVSGLLANGTNLEEIYTQKWVSMFGRGLQSWIDYRRTGVPSLSPVATGIVDIIPKRFTYPQNEYSANSANVTNAVQGLDNGDNLDSNLIWTKQ